MLKKKNNIFIKKQKKKNINKQKINFKLNKQLEKLKILKILNNSNIIIFFQFLSLNNKNDNILFKFFLDKNMLYSFLSKKNLKSIVNKYTFLYLKNFNNILGINNIKDLIILNNIWIEKKILILGYYLNNIFFYKKDFKIINLNIKKFFSICLVLKRRIISILIKIIFLLKNYIKKILSICLILKKKNGNN